LRGRSIKQYLTRREDLALAVVLVDANIEPQEKDAQLLDFLEEECKVRRAAADAARRRPRACVRPGGRVCALVPPTAGARRGQVKTTVVATKVDKLKKNDVEPTLKRLRESLALPDDQPLPFSATKKAGVRELWQLLQQECTSRDR